MWKIKKKITKTVLPHTKLSGGTAKMLWPFSDSGWAQVAVTKPCSVLPSSHGGSHFSWQSHRKLSLLIWLKARQKGRVKCDRKGGIFASVPGMTHRLPSASAVKASKLEWEMLALTVPLLRPRAVSTVYLKAVRKCSFWLSGLDSASLTGRQVTLTPLV